MVPKVWNDMVEAHRREMRDAILDTTANLVAEYGPLGVTMSRVAEQAGIGRATLYKYFPDSEAILLAWHERQLTGHVAHLAEVRDRAKDVWEQLEAVLEAFVALSRSGPQGNELAALLHRGEHVAQATRHLHDLITNLLAEGAEAGHFRDDVPPGELAAYCLNALSAARELPSKAAVQRLVAVVLDGLGPSRAH